MSNSLIFKTNFDKTLIWTCSILAVLTAIAYLLVAEGFLPIGGANATAGDRSIIFVAAGCYFAGGLMIHIKRRWLWGLGLTINLLVILFYFSMYITRPEILLSAGGLTTKFYQILLEVALIILIIRSRVFDRKQARIIRRERASTPARAR